jgi:hypothetical protein
MKKKGTGTILQNEEPPFSGSYNITEETEQDTQARRFGTFKVSDIEVSKFIAISNPPLSPLVLVIEGGDRYSVNLADGRFNPTDGSAEFKIIFLP